MASTSIGLRGRLVVDKRNIANLGSTGFFRPLSGEHKGLDGPRPHIAIVDELHEHPTAMVVDKLRAGFKRRKNPLLICITNSGHDRTTVCWQYREYTLKVLEGILQDDSWFGYVCALDPCDACRAEGKTMPAEDCPDCDQWDDEALWPKVTPGIDVILPRKYLREQVREAKGMPAKEGIVKRLNFNVWTESATRAIPMDRWDACAVKVNFDDWKGRDCFAGLDIGATSDFTALTLLFPHDDAEEVELPPAQAVAVETGDRLEPVRFIRRSYTLLPVFWLPEHPRFRDERMTLLIDQWRRQGFIRTTPGNVVDYQQVLGEIVELSQCYNFQKIAFDRGFQGASMGTNLMARFGEELVENFHQGIISMAAPFREMGELLIQGRLHHDGNPVMRWMASNCVAEQRGGLTKPSKEQSNEKIDGVTSLVMALGVALQALPTGDGKIEIW